VLAGNPYPETVPGLDLADVQGNILCGYRMGYVRHVVLRIADPAAARTALGAMVDGTSPVQVTSAAPWPRNGTPGGCLNVGITFTGLRALGVPEPSLAGFPPEFRDGMVARAARLGDTGPSAPECWDTRLWDVERVHVILTIHAGDTTALDLVTGPVLQGRGFQEVDRFDGAAFPEGEVHFGYRDGIAQPRFAGIHDPKKFPDRQPLVPLGAVLLGHPSPFGDVRWGVPHPEALGFNGSFNAFRVLAQDVAAFEEFLVSVVKLDEGPLYLTRDLVAAKLCGRWPNGVPLQQAPMAPPDDPAAGARSLDDFDYDEDPTGRVCPLGAHIRRSNPRSSPIVQRGSNHTRRLVRRGMPYGPRFDPLEPKEAPRGLLGNFLCANLAAQFEAVQGDWINQGLQDPRLSGSNDPLTGANAAAGSCLEMTFDGGPSMLVPGLTRFVTTRGGAYTFLPSLTALRWIAALAPASRHTGIRASLARRMRS
jgi:deferrochelatase/peroxidase EfeB